MQLGCRSGVRQYYRVEVISGTLSKPHHGIPIPEKASTAVIVFRPRVGQTPHLFLRCEKLHTGLPSDQKNNRWLCSDQAELPIVISSNLPTMVIVLSVVSNEGDVMPPHIFTLGLRVNNDEFINILETLTKPWMD
jgi:hypothetical protein